MGSVFRLEGGLMGALTKISDICIISLLWLFCCLPVVTIRGIHDGSLLYSYKSGQASVRQSYTKLFHSFRENLKRQPGCESELSGVDRAACL